MIYILLITIILVLYNFSFEFNLKRKINLNSKLSYDNLLDLRGILAIVIIYHHLVVCCSLDIQLEIISNFLSHLGYLCVAVFLFMSGVGLEYKFNSKGKEYLSTIPSKIKFMLVLFILINILYFLISPLYLSYSKNLRTLFIGFFNGFPLAGPSWFLINLVLLYFAFYISKKCKYSHIIIALEIICLNFLYFCLNYPVIWGISNLSFLVAVLTSNYIYKKDILVSPTLVLCLTCCLLMVFTIISYLPVLNGGCGKYFCQLLSTPFFSIFVVLSYVLFIPKRKWFNILGKHSLEIFLIHVLFYKTLRGNYIYINNDFIFISLTIVCSILTSIPLGYINKFLAKSIK